MSYDNSQIKRIFTHPKRIVHRATINEVRGPTMPNGGYSTEFLAFTICGKIYKNWEGFGDGDDFDMSPYPDFHPCPKCFPELVKS